jgi:hypothetical protein
VTRPGIDPGTFRLSAQLLNQYATAGPDIICIYGKLRGNIFFSGYIRKQEKLNTSMTLFITLCLFPGNVRVSGNCTKRNDGCQEFAEDYVV